MTTSGQQCKYLVSNINIYLVEPVFCMKKILALIAAIIVTSWLFAVPQANQTALEVSPIDTINVVCYDLILNTDYIGLFGMTYIYANNEDYKLTGAIFADSVPPGTYTECVMDLTHLATSKKIPAASVTLTLAVDANKNCAITGTMLGEDSLVILYTERRKEEDELVTVPDLKGVSVGIAKATLNAYHLNFEVAGAGHSETSLAFCVNQSVEAGEKVDPGTVIGVEFRQNAVD